MDNLIGQVLNNRYSILELVGSGGMSRVYKAEDTLENRFVAIKVLKDERVKDVSARRRFLNESRAIAMLSHKNIVDVLDVNFEDDLQYIVMEYIEGITLKEFMKIRGALSVDEALVLCSQILQALKHAHERGVIHRDIKPENIMLLPNGRLKVTDFGIAHISEFDTETLTDMAVGSVQYISPEQAKGNKSDEKSDVYSTGIILYEMVTGKLPFDSDNAVTIAVMQVENQPVHPSEIVPTLPVGVEQIILKAMQKNPNYRYCSAGEMLEDITAYNENNAIVFNHTVPKSGADIFDGDGFDDMDKKRISPKKVRIRNRLITAAAGVVAAAIIVLLCYALMNNYLISKASLQIPVPALTGRMIEDVLADASVTDNFAIVRQDKFSSASPVGTVLSQSISAGRVYAMGTEITVVVSLGDETTTIPALVGKSLMSARAALKNAELDCKVEYMERDSVEANTVISCSPLEGETVAVDTVITLVISVHSESEEVVMMQLVGQNRDIAIEALTANGLGYSINIVNSTAVEGVVINQEPEEGKVILKGSEVTLYVSSGIPPVTVDPEPDPEIAPDPDNPNTGDQDPVD